MWRHNNKLNGGLICCPGCAQSLYRGFLPNALKNLPNKGIRLSVFDVAKKIMTGSEQAYKVRCLRDSALGLHNPSRLRSCCRDPQPSQSPCLARCFASPILQEEVEAHRRSKGQCARAK